MRISNRNSIFMRCKTPCVICLSNFIDKFNYGLSHAVLHLSIGQIIVCDVLYGHDDILCALLYSGIQQGAFLQAICFTGFAFYSVSLMRTFKLAFGNGNDYLHPLRKWLVYGEKNNSKRINNKRRAVLK